MDTQEKFETYAIVELFGHQIIAGLVQEQEIGSQNFLRVDVPEVENAKGYTKFYGAKAIYAITPVDHVTMLAAVKSYQVKPVEEWRLKHFLPTQQEVDGEDFGFDDEWEINEL